MHETKDLGVCIDDLSPSSLSTKLLNQGFLKNFLIFQKKNSEDIN